MNNSVFLNKEGGIGSPVLHTCDVGKLWKFTRWQDNNVAKILKVRARKIGESNADWSLISNSLSWISKTQTCASQVRLGALLALAYRRARLMLHDLSHIPYLPSLASILFKPFNSQTPVPAFLTRCLKTCGSSPNEVSRAAKCEASLGLLCTPPAQGCGAFCSFLIQAWAAFLVFSSTALSLTSEALRRHLL